MLDPVLSADRLFGCEFAPTNARNSFNVSLLAELNVFPASRTCTCFAEAFLMVRG